MRPEVPRVSNPEVKQLVAKYPVTAEQILQYLHRVDKEDSNVSRQVIVRLRERGQMKMADAIELSINNSSDIKNLKNECNTN